MKSNRRFLLSPLASVAILSSACSGEDAGYVESAEQTASSSAAVSFVNSSSHDDPVDSPSDTSWITPMGETPSALIRVLLTDAPLDAESVFVAFCGIDVLVGNFEHHQAQRITTDCQSVDLLSLQDGVTEAVGLGELEPGDYAGLRVVVRSGSMVLNGVEEPLTLPSEHATDGFVIGRAFSLATGDALTLTIDFDAEQSIQPVADGSYTLEPSLSVAEQQNLPDAR